MRNPEVNVAVTRAANPGTGPPPPYDISSDHGPPVQVSHSDISLPDWQSKRPNLRFILLPIAYTDGLTSFDVKWEVRLEVCAKDLSCLMRRGVYWDESNAQQENGHFLGKTDLPAYATRSSWTMARSYSLRDLSDSPGWVARLRVYAHEIHVLSEFRLRNLSMNDIWAAKAYNEEGKHVYNFESNKEKNSFNTIYDDMRLGGWWPWPSKDSEAEATGIPRQKRSMITSSTQYQIFGMRHFTSEVGSLSVALVHHLS